MATLVVASANVLLVLVTTIYAVLTSRMVKETTRVANIHALLDLMRFVQDPEIRRCRTVVNEGDEDLDFEEPDVRRAAAAVCANYDSMGVLLQREELDLVQPAFIEAYAWSICRSRQRVDLFIEERRKTAGEHYLRAFDRLATDAAADLRARGIEPPYDPPTEVPAPFDG